MYDKRAHSDEIAVCRKIEVALDFNGLGTGHGGKKDAVYGAGSSGVLAVHSGRGSGAVGDAGEYAVAADDVALGITHVDVEKIGAWGAIGLLDLEGAELGDNMAVRGRSNPHAGHNGWDLLVREAETAAEIELLPRGRRDEGLGDSARVGHGSGIGLGTLDQIRAEEAP